MEKFQCLISYLHTLTLNIDFNKINRFINKMDPRPYHFDYRRPRPNNPTFQSNHLYDSMSQLDLKLNKSIANPEYKRASFKQEPESATLKRANSTDLQTQKILVNQTNNGMSSNSSYQSVQKFSKAMAGYGRNVLGGNCSERYKIFQNQARKYDIISYSPKAKISQTDLRRQVTRIRPVFKLINLFDVESFAKRLQFVRYLEMQLWEETLLDVSNDKDHQAQHTVPKQYETITLQSPGRYHITLSRKLLTEATFEAIVEQIKQEFGLQSEQLQITAIQLPVQLQQKQKKLIHIFNNSKIDISGDILTFMSNHQIGQLSDFSSIVNDGNTIIVYFKDTQYQYILFHEIHY